MDKCENEVSDLYLNANDVFPRYSVKNVQVRLNPLAKSFTPNNICTKAIISNTFIPTAKLAKHTADKHAKVVSDSQLAACDINNSEDNELSILNEIWIKNPDKVIISHLNINSIRNKIDELASLVRGKVDILLITESKIDDSFPTNQFLIPGFSIPFRKDRNGNGGGILLYARNDIPSKMISNNNPPFENNYENIFIEINLYKKRWLIGCSYNPTKAMIYDHTNYLSKCLDHFSSSYENIIILGDLNSEICEPAMSEFCDIYNLKSLIRVPTCFKNPENPTCIDLILTNRSNSFQNSSAIETGLSDFHKMVFTVLRTTYRKGPPKIILYRDYKNFSNLNFRRDLESNFSLTEMCNMSNDNFVDVFMHVFGNHAPIKQKAVRCNDSPFITKMVRKEIMKRSSLRNKYLKHRTDLNKECYNKQRNYCTHLIKKAKKEYYSHLNPSSVSNSMTFWKTVKPLFTDKILTGDNIVLVENDEIVNENDKIADIFIIFFSNAVNMLNIEKINLNPTCDEITDPVLSSIKKYEYHPSIRKIEQFVANKKGFSFSHATHEVIESVIKSLKSRVSCPIYSIPPKIFKENIDMFAIKLYNDFNRMVDQSIFPNNCKLADITPAHKKYSKMEKVNYRPVSILPSMAKIFERLLFNQLVIFLEDKLSTLQCGFRKGYSTQHCLIVMLEKWKQAIDKGNATGALLSDLSKAFDCLDHNLMVAKLHAYGCDYNSLKLINSYLRNRLHRVKVNSTYSRWTDILSGVPQGSILGPLLFNIYLNDLFLFFGDDNIASYADDTTPYTCKPNMEEVITKLEEDSIILINWINNNHMKANPDKFHIILSNKDELLSVKVDNHRVFNRSSEKLLGVTIDSKLTFDEHVSSLCKKASQKLHALSRVAHYMDISKRKVIMNAFINSQFGYCPLVWMCHSRKLNNRINKIQERGLRIVYDDVNSTYEELLTKDGTVTVHEKNIQKLAIEMYRVINNCSPDIMKDIFQIKEKDIYKSKFPFKSNNVKTVNYGTHSLRYLGPKVWSMLPENLKKLNTLEEFKLKIRQWKPIGCICRLCKNYVHGVGFVD